MKKFLKNWKTSVLGFGSLALSALVTFGYLTPEDAIKGNEALAALVQQIGGGILAVTGFLGIFSKDGDKSSEEVGIPAQG